MNKLRTSYLGAVAALVLSVFVFAPLSRADLLGGSVTPPPPPVETPPVETIITPPADTVPPVIAGVLSTSVSDIAATIVWTTSELATSHLEFGTTSAYGMSATLPASALLVHAGVLTGLAENTTYYYCLHATDVAGNAAQDCGHSFTTQIATDTTPPVITQISATSVSPTSVTIAWTTDEATSSLVQYGLNTDYGLRAAGIYATSHSITVTDLSPNTEYHYRVVSVDGPANVTTTRDYTFTTQAQVVAQSSSSGSSGSTTVSTSVVVPVVSGIVTTESAPGAVTISWVSDIPTDAQVVYGETTGYGQSTPLNTTLATSHSVTISNLSLNTAYHYQVKSKSALGQSAVTADQDFATLSLSVPAPTISSIVAQTTNGGATVTWTTDVPASSQVEYGLDTAYNSQTTVNPTLVTSHSAAIPNLAPGTAYNFRVVSESAGGEISFSTNHILTTSDAGNSLTTSNPTVQNSAGAGVLPNVISGFTVSDVEARAVTLNITTANTPTNAALQYDIRYSTSPITDSNFNSATPAQETPIYFDTPASGSTAEHAYVVLELSPATQYYFAVKTKDQHGNTAPISNVVSATTVSNPALSPSAGSGAGTSATAPGGSQINGGSGGAGGTITSPIHLRAEATESSSVISWTNPTESNFIRVKILRKAGSFPASLHDGQAIYEGTAERFTDINLVSGQTYYYAIFAVNHLSQVSVPVQFAVTPKAGVAQVNLVDTRAGTSGGCGGQDLSFGMKNDSVRQLQQYLLSLGAGIYPRKLITGYFHKYTQDAVKRLQIQYSLSQTGVWDQATRNAVHVCLGTQGSSVTAVNSALNRDLQLGMQGSDVRVLQQYLINMKVLESKFLTGYFGKFTQAAVIKLQQNNNIQPVNGVAGAATRNLVK